MRLLRSFLISIVISVISAFTVFAAQGTISFSDPEVTVGDEVNVTMKITADEGTELDSANIVLTYPASGLEFISGTDADGGAGAGDWEGLDLETLWDRRSISHCGVCGE